MGPKPTDRIAKANVKGSQWFFLGGLVVIFQVSCTSLRPRPTLSYVQDHTACFDSVAAHMLKENIQHADRTSLAKAPLLLHFEQTRADFAELTILSKVTLSGRSQCPRSPAVIFHDWEPVGSSNIDILWIEDADCAADTSVHHDLAEHGFAPINAVMWFRRYPSKIS